MRLRFENGGVGPGAYDRWVVEGLEAAGEICFDDREVGSFFFLGTNDEPQGPLSFDEAEHLLYQHISKLVTLLTDADFALRRIVNYADENPEWEKDVFGHGKQSPDDRLSFRRIRVLLEALQQID